MMKKYWKNSIEYEEILEQFKRVWDKIKTLFKNKFGNEPVQNDKYIKYI